MRSHPISYERLLSFVAGELHADEAGVVAAHVAGCAACRTTVERYRQVQAVAHADVGLAPSAAALARVKGLLVAPPPVPRPSLGDAMRRVIGRLTFDSRGAFALSGVRGALSAYHLGFESEDADVDLQISPPDDDDAGWRLLGQVDLHVAEPPVAAVDLTPVGGGAPMVAAVDADGVFALQTPPGRYDLVVRHAALEVVLPDLEIG